MPGRHASDDKSRFRRDLFRLAVYLLILLVVATATVLALRAVFSSDDPDPVSSSPTVVAGTEATQPQVEETITTAALSTTTAPLEPTTTTITTTTTIAPVLQPEQLTVLVLNSTATAGLAGRLTERVDELGYNTLPPDNYTPALQVSVIQYAEGLEREAEVLAVHVPDANLESASPDASADLTVVLGDSFVE